MRRISVFLTLIFVSMALFSWANGKDGKAISGTVAGVNGAPLIGATLQLVGSGKGATTNERGIYRIGNVRPGAYTLKASFIGYKSQEVKVDVKENVTLNLTLEVQNVLGDEVVVSATRASKRTPMAFTDMKAYEIKKVNTGGDVAQIFELTPSFVSTTESGIGIGNTSFSIRGTDASRINITVDGFPINDPESQQVFFVNMPDVTSSASSVQIQRGVGTSTNGAGAFGATVNFQTGALSNEPYAEINNYVGSYNSWRGNVLLGTGIINNRFSFDARISRAKSDGYVERATSDHKSAQVSGTYHGDRSMLKATILYGEEKTGISWTGVPSSAIDTNRTYNPEGYYFDSKGVRHIYENQTDNYKQTHYLTNYTTKLGDNASLNVGVFYTRGLGFYDNYKDDEKFYKFGLPSATIDNVVYAKSDFVVQKWLDNDNVGGTFALNLQPSSQLAITVGGAASQFTNHHYGKMKWVEHNVGNIPADFEWYRSKSTKKDGNIYGKISWLATERLNIYGDMQYRNIDYTISGIDDKRDYDGNIIDISQQHTYHFFNPKVGASFAIGGSSSVFASLAVANREPTRSDFKDATNPSKRPSSERLFDYEAGYKYAGSVASLGVNLYYMQYKDQLVLTGKVNDVGSPIRENVPNSYRAGVELMAGVNLFNNLKWEGNLTLSQNKINNFTLLVETYDLINGKFKNFEMREYKLGTTRISYSPDVIGSSQFSLEAAKNLRLVFVSKYVGKQYYDNSENANRMLKAYFVNNLRAEYTFSMVGLKDVTFQMGVNNLFDEKYIANAWIYRAEFRNAPDYIEDGLFPQATRNYWCRLALRF